MTIGVIDMIVLGILVFSVLFALYRGLVSELLGISSWILAGFGALYSYTPMQPVMGKFIENEKIAGICGALLVALIILVVATIISSHISHKLRESSLSGLDRLLGLMFGLLRGILLIALLYIGLSMLVSDKQLEEISRENVSVPYVQKTVGVLKNFVPQNVQADLGLSHDNSEGKPKKIGADLKRNHKLPAKSNKKAVDRFMDHVQKDIKAKSTKKTTTKPAGNSNVIQKVADKTKENLIKTVPAVAPQYNDKQRESLDNMVELLMEKGE